MLYAVGGLPFECNTKHTLLSFITRVYKLCAELYIAGFEKGPRIESIQKVILSPSTNLSISPSCLLGFNPQNTIFEIF